MAASLAPSFERYREVRAGLETPLPARYNIAEAACDRWAGDPGRPALLVPEAAGVRVHTFAELADASERFANGLAALGVRRGDPVAVSLPQSFECAVAHVAIQRLGAFAVPLTVLYGREALEHRLTASGATVALGWWESHAWLREDPLWDATRWVMAGGEPAGVTSFDAVLRSGASGREPVASALDDPALVIYTSGTTGLAKGVLHAQRVVPAHTEPISLAHNFFPRADDVFWSPADWAWAGGLVDCLFAALTAGRPIVAWRSRGFDPEAALDTIERCGVTNTFLPPTALRLLREVPGIGERSGGLRLRSVMTGGERVGQEIVDWCLETLGLMPNEVFGQTEASCVLGNSYTLLPARAGSVGWEYPRARVTILDGEGGEAAAGEVGEIAVHRSTPAMFLGYWQDGGLVAAGEGEWHRTGDLGSRDVDGYFWHHGRADDLILSAGYRIGPGEVEECLSHHAAVRTVSVIGLPDPVRGEIVAAVIELREGVVADAALEDDLKAIVRSRLAPYEVPRQFHFVASLPRTETGKIRRADLRKTYGTPG